MANARAIGQMLADLRSKASASSKSEITKKPKDGSATKEKSKVKNTKRSMPSDRHRTNVTKEKVKAKTDSKSHNAEKDKDNDDSDKGNPAPTHPKAVGNLLKMLQSNKDRYYEEPQRKKSTYEYDFKYDSMFQEKKQKLEAYEIDFYCDLCKVSCTSQVVLDAHLVGKRHMKNVKKLEDVTLAFKDIPVLPPSKQLFSAQIQPELDNLAITESLVGLEYVTEYQSSEVSGNRYFCELCEFRSNMADILYHIIGRQHRLRYMRSHFFEIYYKITGYPSFTNIMSPFEADKLLHQHSSFVIRTILKGVLPQCRVKPFRGEASMQIDLRKHPGPGGIHPSQHKDLPKVEYLFEAAEIAEQKEKEELEKQEKEMEKKKEMEQKQEFERQQKIKHQQFIEKQREIELLAELRKERLAREAAHTRDQILDHSRVSSHKYALEKLETQKVVTTTTLIQESRLDEQEARIKTALNRLRGSCQDREMNNDELSAQKKLIRLLAGIKAQRQSFSMHGRGETQSKIDTNKHSVYEDALSEKSYPRFEVRCQDSDVQESPGSHVVEVRSDQIFQRKIHNAVAKSANQQDSASMVGSVIEKTRQQIEEKILQALTSGSLAPLAEAFKNNPKLQAGLKHWEKTNSETYSGATTSQKVVNQSDKSVHYDSSVTFHDRGFSLNHQGTSQTLNNRISNSLVRTSIKDDPEKEYFHTNPVDDMDSMSLPVTSSYREVIKLSKTPRHSTYPNNHSNSNNKYFSRSDNLEEFDSQASSSGGPFRAKKVLNEGFRKSKYTSRNDKFIVDYDHHHIDFEDDRSKYADAKFNRQDFDEDSTQRNYSKKEESRTWIGSRPQFNQQPSPPRRKYSRDTSSRSRTYYH